MRSQAEWNWRARESALREKNKPNTSNVMGLEIIFVKTAILFDFASNVHSLSVLSASSDAEIIVEIKWQRILHLFQRIEFSMFLGYLESILENYIRVFFRLHFKPSGKKALYLPPPLWKFAPFTPLYPLEFPWPYVGGMDIFFNHTIFSNGAC